MAQFNRRHFVFAGGGWWLGSRLAFLSPWSSALGQSTETPEDRARRTMEEIRRALENPQQRGHITDPELLARDREMMQRAKEQDAREVDQLYSTRPIRFRLGKHEYVVPHNYFAAKDFREPQTKTNVEYFGFYLFLPNFGGYTKENWRDRFDRRRIDVIELSTVEKIAVGTFADGSVHPLPPDRFDPRVRFESIKSLQEEASIQLYGLTMYRNKGAGNTPGAAWTGTRSNGEFFWFWTSLAEGESTQDEWPPNPRCDVRYYSEKEDLSIAYQYSQDHLSKWREIDDAIWLKIHEWRV